MLVIRLARTGRKKQPYYRLTVADKRRAATGKFVAQIGHFNPYNKELVVKKEQLENYLKNGAQPSSTVVKLLKKHKISLPKWAEANLVVKKKPPKVKKTEGEQEEVKPASVPAETAVEDTEEKIDKPAPKAEPKADSSEPAKKPAEEPEAETSPANPPAGGSKEVSGEQAKPKDDKPAKKEPSKDKDTNK